MKMLTGDALRLHIYMYQLSAFVYVRRSEIVSLFDCSIQRKLKLQFSI